MPPRTTSTVQAVGAAAAAEPAAAGLPQEQDVYSRFRPLKLCEELICALDALGIKEPTEIQVGSARALPRAHVQRGCAVRRGQQGGLTSCACSPGAPALLL